MTEFSFPNVSVASSGGEYFQVSFADKEDSDDAYFLIQRQFESPDRGHIYIESHERMLCGHFKIRKTELRRNALRLELVCQPAQTVQLRFEADGVRYDQLKTLLKTMIPSIAIALE
jgi:hypothetical protein